MMCSALHIHGIEHIGRVLADLEYWLQKREYSSLWETRGSLSGYRCGYFAVRRGNYIKTLSSYSCGKQWRRSSSQKTENQLKATAVAMMRAPLLFVRRLDLLVPGERCSAWSRSMRETRRVTASSRSAQA